MTRPLKIDFVLPSLVIGGMETVTVGLAESLLQRGHTTRIVCLNEGGPLEEVAREAGISVAHVRAPGFKSQIWAPKLTAFFREHAPDVVNTTSGVWGRAARAAHLAQVPVGIQTVHGKLDIDPWYDVPLKRWEARHSDRVVCVSDALANDLRARVGLPTPKIRLIQNGVDVARFTPQPDLAAEVRQELQSSDEESWVIVARLAPVKNVFALVEAFARYSSEYPRAKLTVVGDGPLLQELKARSIQLNPSAFRFLGARKDVARLLQAFDFFVLASFAEGLPMGVLEAMATGVYPVVTPFDSALNIIRDKTHGVVARGFDPSSIYSALKLARSHREEIGSKELVKTLSNRVSAEFSSSKMVDQYETLYREVLKEKQLT